MSKRHYLEEIKSVDYPKPTIFAILFAVLVLIEITGVASNLLVLQISAKPLLMPTLMVYLFYSYTTVKNSRLLFVALFFSALGDIFLLFEFIQPLFFVLGLASFLITHIFYIIFFMRIRSPYRSFYVKQPWWLLLIYGYSFGLLILVYPNLGELEIPVVVYAIIISIMLMLSLHIQTKVNHPANKYYLSGAILFILSDSLLAINKFYSAFPLAGVWIIITYCSAQFLIVQGFVLHKTEIQYSN